MNVYPLKFAPLAKRRLWGGRRLEALFGKPLPPNEPIGETWELADLEADQSVVAVGPAKGKTLRQLVEEWGTDLLGRAELIAGRFPLLIKFLDARETLSVQVHPDAAMAARLGGSVRVKHEAWYVIDAEPGACIYRGLTDGVDRDALAGAIRDGTVERVLRKLPVKSGQCYYLPSGTLHALGAGVVVTEVQTPSDVTYRVFDWNRVDPATGRPRELHVEEALQCVHFDEPHEPTQKRAHVVSVWTTVTRLADCPSFIIEKVRMVEGLDQEIPYAEPVVWIVLEGSGTITAKSAPAVPFAPGDVVLLPASLKEGRVQTRTDCVWLEVTVPVASDLAGFGRPSSAVLQARDGTDIAPVQLGLPRRGKP